MFIKNKKGFNLFTALISLMLLSITIVFIYNMVQTEENYLSLIDDQSKSSDLLTIADISRADAFNNFVVSFREQWMSFRSSPENFVRITRKEAMLDWNGFVDYFADYIFFDNQFETFFASNVVTSLTYTNPPLGYGINVPNYNKEDLSRIIKQSFNYAGDKKIQVVSCEQENNSCLGTLYFTIDTRNLLPEDYEKLPMIVVKRNADDEVIQRPVFARREYKIYLPWRGFQAMRTVRNFSFDFDLEKKDSSDILSGSSNSKGFFNPYIHYTLNSAKLGVCDIDSCALREDLFRTVSTDGFTGNECKNPPTISNVKANNGGGYTVNGTVINLSSSASYSNQNSDSIKSIFDDLLKTTIKNNISSQNMIYAGTNLPSVLSSNYLPNECSNPINGGNFNICNLTLITPQSRTTKNVINENLGESPSITTIASIPFNPNSFNKASNLGLSLDNDRNIFLIQDDSIIQQLPDNQYLSCQKIEEIRLLFKFEEENQKYIFSENSKNIYIQLEDSFSKYSFYPPSTNPTFTLGVYFNHFQPSTVNLSSGWSCKNYEPVTAGTAGCINTSVN